MELKNILKNGTEFKEQVYMLYEEAFPAEEKKPISLMEHLAEKGQMELFAACKNLYLCNYNRLFL